MKSCNWVERSVCTKKREDLFVVKEGERRGLWVYQWIIEEGIH